MEQDSENFAQRAANVICHLSRLSSFVRPVLDLRGSFPQSVCMFRYRYYCCATVASALRQRRGTRRGRARHFDRQVGRPTDPGHQRSLSCLHARRPFPTAGGDGGGDSRPTRRQRARSAASVGWRRGGSAGGSRDYRGDAQPFPPGNAAPEELLQQVDCYSNRSGYRSNVSDRKRSGTCRLGPSRACEIGWLLRAVRAVCFVADMHKWANMWHPGVLVQRVMIACCS